MDLLTQPILCFCVLVCKILVTFSFWFLNDVEKEIKMHFYSCNSHVVQRKCAKLQLDVAVSLYGPI